MTVAPLWLSFRDQQRLRRAAQGIAPVPVRLVDMTTSLLTSDAVLLVDASSAAVTLTLPEAREMEGRTVIVKVLDATNAVTVQGDGGETLDGAADVVLATQYDVCVLLSDGAAWHIL